MDWLRKKYDTALKLVISLREENDRAWSQYHSAIHEYALLRETLGKLQEEHSELELKYQDEYLRRKCAERLLASNRAQAVREINRES